MPRNVQLHRYVLEVLSKNRKSIHILLACLNIIVNIGTEDGVVREDDAEIGLIKFLSDGWSELLLENIR
jgi:hypothetical protein